MSENERNSLHASAGLTFIHEGRSFQARNFTSVTPHPQLTKPSQRHARGNSCVKRGRSSTQFVRDDGLPNGWSEKKRSHSCETNSQQQPHRWRTIRSACQHWTALVQRRQLAWPVKAGDRVVVVKVGPTRWRSQRLGPLGWAWSRVLRDVSDIGQNSYRLDSIMNARPQKALARNGIFLCVWVVYLFRWQRLHQQKKKKKKKSVACHRISELVISHVNSTT